VKEAAMLSANGSEKPGSETKTPRPDMKDEAAVTESAASPVAAEEASNGSTSPMVAKARKQANAMRNSLALTQIIGVLMRSQHYRQYTLGDLDWLVIPPVMAGQFRIGEVKSKKDGATLPVAVLLWAKVSPEVDERLTKSDDPAIRLSPQEWTSGDILWLTHAAGEPRFVRHLLKQISETAFKGLAVKTRARGEDGKVVVQLLPTTAQDS
jgi:hemolysin-activating ACP:hemolysin acyltransferase